MDAGVGGLEMPEKECGRPGAWTPECEIPGACTPECEILGACSPECAILDTRCLVEIGGSEARQELVCVQL